MRMKLINPAHNRNIRKACKALGKRVPKDYHTATATNGDFVVYDSGSRIIGRLLPSETETFLRD